MNKYRQVIFQIMFITEQVLFTVPEYVLRLFIFLSLFLCVYFPNILNWRKVMSY